MQRWFAEFGSRNKDDKGDLQKMKKKKNMVVGSPFLRYVGDFCLRQ